MRMLKIILIYLLMFFLLILPVYALEGSIKGDSIRIRKEPNTDCETLEYVSSGDKIEIIQKEDNWYKIKAKGVTGYVREDFIKLKDETNTDDNTVNNNDNNNTNSSNNIDDNDSNINNEMEIYIIPLINSSVIGVIKKDKKVQTGEKINGWSYITYENISGWVRESNLSSVQVNETNNPQNNSQQQEETQEQTQSEQEETTTTTSGQIVDKTGYINVDSAYFRKEPSSSSEMIGGLIKNQEVKIIEELEGWYKVEVDGKTGYVADWLVSEKRTDTSSRGTTATRTIESEVPVSNIEIQEGLALVDDAKQFLGKPYVYGGSGPNSFDCSGFTMYVFKNYGISLPHTATGQSKYGTYVAKENLQPGDLVFFKDYQTMDGIGHCGIYIGEGDFIHASSGTGYCVKISTLLSGSYYTRYETARRLI